MPAHRSNAEGEIREAVVSALRRYRPEARIIHEIYMGGGVNRADLMCVGRDELITVEIKSERDKLDRLPDQIDTMRKCSHIAIAALHRKFMPEPETLAAPRLDCVPWGVPIWWYPKAQDMAEAHHPAFTWPEPDRRDTLAQPLPADALHLLHRDELAELCCEIGVAAGKRANMKSMIAALRWGATGRDLTLGICRALRRRTLLAEADPAIED